MKHKRADRHWGKPVTCSASPGGRPLALSPLDLEHPAAAAVMCKGELACSPLLRRESCLAWTGRPSIGLLAPPSGEVAGTVQEGQDLDPRAGDLVDQTIPVRCRLPPRQLGGWPARTRLLASAEQPFLAELFFDLLMGESTSRSHVGLAALDSSQDIKVVQHVVHAAVIGQPVQQGPHSFFGFHSVLLQRVSLRR